MIQGKRAAENSRLNQSSSRHTFAPFFWDFGMLKQSALEFGRALADLRLMAVVCSTSAKQMTPEEFHTVRLTLEEVIGNLQRIAILHDLVDAIGPELQRFQTALSTESAVQLSSRAENLRNRVNDELSNEWFFQVDKFEVRYYEKQDLFGEGVTKKFPGASADIRSAGNCIALQQPDAVVFHLMKAMEVAVRQLGKRLNMTITPQTTWRQLTGNMDVKIKSMPDKSHAQKEKKNRWEEARANLHQVGSVWRNNTMHPAVSYDRSQAFDIFNAVRVFMSVLAQL